MTCQTPIWSSWTGGRWRRLPAFHAPYPPACLPTLLPKELRSEAAAAGNAAAAVRPLLSAASLERALTARLSVPPGGHPQWPVHYLLGVYARASGVFVCLRVCLCLFERERVTQKWVLDCWCA